MRGSACLTAVIVVEWGFQSATGALGATTGADPARAAHDHDALVVALLLGGLTALMTATNVNEATVTGQAVTLGFIAALMSAMLVLGMALGSDRAAALAVMIVVLVAGVYCRRFGPRGAMSAVLAFTGYFFGYFLSQEVPVSEAPWLVCEVVIAVAVSALVRLTLFRPSASGDLVRLRRSYRHDTERVLEQSLAVLRVPTGANRSLLGRRTRTVNETALLIDSQLGPNRAVPPEIAPVLHQQLFDVQLCLGNVSRFAEALAGDQVWAAPGSAVVESLRALARGAWNDALTAADELASALRGGPGPDRDPVADATKRIVLYRFAGSVTGLVDALEKWHRDVTGLPAHGGSFEPAVSLRSGWLPGSADVSATTSELPSSQGPRAHIRLTLPARSALQVAVATTVALVAGDALDPPRFYWAVVAALLALVGTFTSAEQVRKALYRVAGTLCGVLVGSGLIDLVGSHSFWSVVVVLGSLFVAVYMFRVNYAFMAFGITVALSQAYLSLDELSHGLLLYRLAETAVGAGAAMLTVLVVFPLRTRRVIGVAASDLVDALAALARRVVPGDGAGPARPEEDLRSLGWRVDAAFDVFTKTAQPLLLGPLRSPESDLVRLTAAAAAARNYARNIVVDLAQDSAGIEQLADAAERLLRSAASLSAALDGAGAAGSSYCRSASLFEAAERSLGDPIFESTHDVLVARDLKLLDGALAGMAHASGMEVTDLDATVLSQQSPRRGTGPSQQA